MLLFVEQVESDVCTSIEADTGCCPDWKKNQKISVCVNISLDQALLHSPRFRKTPDFVAEP